MLSFSARPQPLSSKSLAAYVMNAFFVALVGSVIAGIVAALNAAHAANLGAARFTLLLVAGSLAGLGIYGAFALVAAKVASRQSKQPSWQTSAIGISLLVVVLASPFVTWYAVSAVVARLLHGGG